MRLLYAPGLSERELRIEALRTNERGVHRDNCFEDGRCIADSAIDDRGFNLDAMVM